MTEHNHAVVTNAVAGATAADISMRTDNIGRWGKLNVQESGALASTDDLVDLVQDTLSCDQAQARRKSQSLAHALSL